MTNKNRRQRRDSPERPNPLFCPEESDSGINIDFWDVYTPNDRPVTREEQYCNTEELQFKGCEKNLKSEIKKVKMYSFNLHRSVEPATELANIISHNTIAMIQEPHFSRGGQLLSRFNHLFNFAIGENPRAAIIATKELKIVPCPSLSTPDIACAMYSNYRNEKVVIVSYYFDRVQDLSKSLEQLGRI